MEKTAFAQVTEVKFGRIGARAIRVRRFPNSSCSARSALRHHARRVDGIIVVPKEHEATAACCADPKQKPAFESGVRS